MERSTNKLTAGHPHLGIGSSLAAGAIMLYHMNSSGLTRYDKLIDDLSRLGATPPTPAPRVSRRVERPQRQRPRWVSWIYR